MVRNNWITVCKTPHAWPASSAFILCPPQPSLLAGIHYCQRIWVFWGLSGGREPILLCPSAFAGYVGLGGPGPTQCPASFFLGPCLAGVGMVVIVWPPWLALLGSLCSKLWLYSCHWCQCQGPTPDGLCRWGWVQSPGPAFQDQLKAQCGCGFEAHSSSSGLLSLLVAS